MPQDTDTEASAPLRTQADNTNANTNTNTAQPYRRLESLKEYLKIVFVVITVLLILVNLWVSIRKGEDIAEASSTALASIARAATLEEARTQWKNTTTATIQ